LRALVAEAAGDLASADVAMAWVVRLDRPNVAAWLELGRYEERRRRPLRALDAYQRAVDLDETDPEAWMGLARTWLSLGDRTQASQCRLEAARHGAPTSSFDVALAHLDERPGDAMAALDRWVAADDADAARLAQAAWGRDLGVEHVRVLACGLMRHPVHGAAAAAIVADECAAY
jgi:tetratricopeptide (TPR) repeat protein